MDAYKKDGGDDTDLRRVNSDANSSSSSDDWYVGRVDEDTNTTCVQEAAKQALRTFNANSADENYWFIVSILGSKADFCEGFMHYIKMVLGYSVISKKEMSEELFDNEDKYEEKDASLQKTVIAICKHCKDVDEGEICINPCEEITFSKNIWSEFDVFSKYIK